MASPKSAASPVLEIVTKEMVLTVVPPGYPPYHNPRVDDEKDLAAYSVYDKSPKSIAFPCVDIVT